ncbi:hypothetical protein GGX14DRAFT_596831 [Mycena pura]|uniref:Uncharacterized protein n=1 Tax=Mycena pura TaxID=153505 RepID=A0AAD6Y2W5_9AGAR|nr:hypothetical protein GGX14DRAFT_596831 [Mycena pura]
MWNLAVAVNPANAWVAAAAALWQHEPLNFYTPVKDKVSKVFEFLCSLPARIPTLETFPVTHIGPALTSANVLEDLRHLTGYNVPYSELSGGYSNKELPGEEVLELVSQSELRTPWRNGQRVVALFDLSPLSNTGLRSCKLDLEKIASSCLLPNTIFNNFDFAYGNELGKAFPEKSEWQLKKQGKDLFTSACWVPTGWFTDIHADRSTLSQLIIHHDGEKIWLTWPVTRENLDWFDLHFPSGPTGHHLVLEALGKLRGLHMVHADHPCAFILPPFTLHCVITMRTSSHSGAFFAHADHWATGVTFVRYLSKMSNTHWDLIPDDTNAIEGSHAADNRLNNTNHTFLEATLLRHRSDAQEARIIKASLDSQMAENGNNSIRDRFSAQLGRHARSRAKKAEKAADPAMLKSQLKAKEQEIFELRAQLLRNSQASIVHSSSAQDAAVAGSSRASSQPQPIDVDTFYADPTPQTPVRNSLRASAASVIQQISPFNWKAALDPDIMHLTFAEIAEVTPSRLVRKRGKARRRELFPEAWELKDLSSP